MRIPLLLALLLIAFCAHSHAQIPSDFAEQKAQFDHFTLQLERAKKQDKPMLLFLADESSATAKKIDAEILNRSALGSPYDAFVPARIQLQSEAGMRISKTYRIFKSPYLLILNREGEYVDGLDLSQLGSQLVNESFASQISDWLGKRLERFKNCGGLGYVQKPIPKDDSIHAALNQWKSVREKYRDASKILLLDHCKATIREDGKMVRRARSITALGEEFANRVQNFSYFTGPNDSFEILAARTVTPDGQQNILSADQIKVEPLYRNYPAWDALKVTSYAFPGARAGCLLDLEVEITEVPQMDGHFSCVWDVDGENVPSLDSRFELEAPARFAFQHQVLNHSAPIVETKVAGNLTRLSWSGSSEHFQPASKSKGLTGSKPTSSRLIVATRASWEEIGTWFLKQVDTARVHSAEMDAWAEGIIKAITPGERYEKRVVNALMQSLANDFRYLSIEMDRSGYRPHSAAETFQNKYGDCKDLSLFLQECLKKASIQSTLVMLSQGYVGTYESEIPRVPFFNHCILKVNAPEAGFYVDPTAFGMAAGNLPLEDHSSPGLLCAQTGFLVMTTPAYQDTSKIKVVANFFEIDKPKVRVDWQETFTGPAKDYARRSARGISEERLKEWPPELIGKWFESFETKKAESSGHEPGAEEFKVSFTGSLKQPFEAGKDVLLLPVFLDNAKFLRGLPVELSENESKMRGVYTGWKLPHVTQKLTYQIPKNMELKELPKPIHVDTPYFKVDVEVENQKDKITCNTSVLTKFVPGIVRPILETQLPEAARLLEDKLRAKIVVTRTVSGKPSPEPLHELVEKGNLEALKAFLEKAANLEQKNAKGDTALSLAAVKRRLDLVQCLVEAGSEINVLNAQNECPLFLACNQGAGDVAEFLLANGADTTLVTKRGYTPLMAASGYKNLHHLAKLLLKAGVPINAVSDEGTALFYAVCNKSIETIHTLIDAGADMYLLTREKDNLDSYQYPLLGICAVRPGHIPVMEALLSHKIDVNRPAREGSTPLHLAVLWDQLKNVEFLLKSGASVNLPRNDGRTPAMIASQYLRLDILKQLLLQKPDLNLRDNQGKTALMLACEVDSDVQTRLQAMRQLVEAGCDVNLEDNRGESAYTIAGNRGSVELVAYLAEHGAKQKPLHLIAREKRKDPLPEARRWAIALSAGYFVRNQWDFQYLGGAKRPDVKTAKNILQEWDLKTKTDLLNQLEQLKDAGHHLSYQQQSQKFARFNDQEFENFLAGPTVNPSERERLKAMRVGFLKWGDRNALAWDWCRYVYLLNAGFGAGLISEEEAFAMMMPIAKQIQKSFSSWKELSENFSDGRVIWSGSRDANFEACLHLLRNPEDPNSPWNQLSWDLDLSK